MLGDVVRWRGIHKRVRTFVFLPLSPPLFSLLFLLHSPPRLSRCVSAAHVQRVVPALSMRTTPGVRDCCNDARAVLVTPAQTLRCSSPLVARPVPCDAHRSLLCAAAKEAARRSPRIQPASPVLPSGRCALFAPRAMRVLVVPRYHCPCAPNPARSRPADSASVALDGRHL
ncbi:hypothetical protein C8R47DRAFT_1158161, partial [Mycena vitilis]